MTTGVQILEEINHADMRVGLVGQGIQRSRTPAMHRNEGRAMGVSLAYDLLDINQMSPVPDIADLLASAQADGYAGLNITYPFKKAVMQHLDNLSDAATKVDAVNTVVFRDGKRFGHNTDFWGFAEGMRKEMPDANLETVLLLGAGGAGGAVAHALADANAKRILIADQNPSTAQNLVDRVNAQSDAQVVRVTDLAQAAAEATGIVNATPVGMAERPGTSIDIELLRPEHWVCDIVYFPLETELLAKAKAKGCRTLNGAGMAVFQAVRAFELFTGLKPDPERMRATFETFT